MRDPCEPIISGKFSLRWELSCVLKAENRSEIDVLGDFSVGSEP